MSNTKGKKSEGLVLRFVMSCGSGSFILSIALMLCSCSTELTEIMVVVDTDLRVPAKLDEVVIVVDAEALGGSIERRTAPLESRDDLPVTLGIVHMDGPIGPLLVGVQGVKDRHEILGREAILNFIPGEVVMLRLDLLQGCIGVECLEDESCGVAGCRPLLVGPDELQTWTGEVEGLDPSYCDEEVCNSVDDDCDGVVDEGFDLDNDPANCGECGQLCQRTNADMGCIDGTCVILSCEDGYDNCDASIETGCESSLSSTDNCGQCHLVCSLYQANSTCTNRICEISSCKNDFDNCDRRFENGCEVELTGDVFNCGSCGHECDEELPHSEDACVDRSCTSLCDPGWADCNLDPEDGCESDLSLGSSCGECEIQCTGAAILCSGDARTGYQCIPPPCDDPPTRCGNSCVDTLINEMHCGECYHVCLSAPNAAPLCENGACTLQCDDGYGDCDGIFETGCETPMNTSDDCGGCGVQCSTDLHEACVDGRCLVSSCEPGTGDCDEAVAGCETPIASDILNCGRCGNICPDRDFSEPTCEAGVCGVRCDSGYGDCDGTLDTGCEEPLDSIEYCGSCDHPCLDDGTQRCVEGGCIDETPVIIGDDSFSVGSYHACALVDETSLRCWGRGERGALGTGNPDDVGDNELPSSVAALEFGEPIVQIACGDEHTCILLLSGDVRCWGRGDSGELGLSDTENIGDDEHPLDVGPISLGEPAVQVASGSGHSCAILESGDLRCWGSSDFGQLGYGNRNTIGDNEHPSSVDPVSVGGRVVQVAAGSSHTCAILESGDVRCWGLGSEGRLGQGNMDWIGDNEAPSSVDPISLGGRVIFISVSLYHTCAVLETGEVRCWGRGLDGMLGYGSTEDIGDDEVPSSVDPVSVGGLAVRVATGSEHSCALLESGDIRCWGRGEFGQLGYGNPNTVGATDHPSSVGPVSVGGPVAQVGGGLHATCSLLEDGIIRCWGWGFYGLTGQGNTYNIGDNELPSSIPPISYR